MASVVQKRIEGGERPSLKRKSTPTGNRESLSPDKIDAFTDSFVLFNRTIKKLHQAYKKLEVRFNNLNLELEKTNKRLRQSLAEKDRVTNYLNDILDSLTSGVLVVDLKGVITLFNRAAEQITGWSAQEATGHCYSHIMGEDVPHNSTPLYTLATGAPIVNREKEVRTKDGATVPLNYSTSLVTDSRDNVLGAVETFVDLSRVKMLEKEVKKVNNLAALGQMAATVAHEIRNPLGGIAGFAALLERDLGRNDPRRGLVRKITEGVASLNRIVTDLLTYARPVNLRPQRIDFIKLVDEVVNCFETDVNNCRHEGITLSRRYAASPLYCKVDPMQFRQVILNLLHNAVQAMPEGGELKVEVLDGGLCCRSSEGSITLKVSDTGIGMTEEVKTNCFAPFFTTKENGTGLGLANIKKIVDAHHGIISVTSELGKGSSFIVTFPCDWV